MGRQSFRPAADAGSRLGQAAAVATAALALLSAVVGVTTPPRSGPMCRLADCVTAPYTDVAAYVPRDYLWLYPSIALELAFLVLVVVVVARQVARLVARRIAEPASATAGSVALALVALVLVALGVGLLVVDYGLQLFVVQPSLLAGDGDGLGLLSQYNPHGLFIGLENLGYATIALGWLFLATASAVTSAATVAGRMRVVRWTFLTGGLLTWVFLVGLAAGYRADLEYRFELAAISIHWLVAVVVGTLLTVELRPRPDS